MEGPPPLLDDSSDEMSSDGLDGTTLEGSEDERRGSDNHESPSSSHCDGNSSAGDSLASDNETLPPDHLKQAANFVLDRMKQTRNGLQAWDHADFVRMANQSLLFRPGVKPLVVLQRAQASAFSPVPQKMSLSSKWHRRRTGSFVKDVKDLGMLRQLRESRLIPFRLGCDCLYDHPGLSHLFKSDTATELPRLMHINPSMSGPVRFATSKSGVVPHWVAFAGAEFVVLGETVVGRENYWMVLVELSEFPLETQDDESSTPVLEGLPDLHSRLGTHQSVGYVPKYTEGMQTMVGGKAPVDMDRFKAWHMNPCYHAVSHRVWCLQDVRLFLVMHRLLFILGPLAVCYFSGASTFMWIFLTVLSTTLSLWRLAYDKMIMKCYASSFGTVEVWCIRLFLEAYRVVYAAWGVANSLARQALACSMGLPRVLLPGPLVDALLLLLVFVVELSRCIASGVNVVYHVAVEALVARLPPVGGLTTAVQFVDAVIGKVFHVVFLVVLNVFSLFLWWYRAEDMTPFWETEEKFQDLVNLIDPESRAEFVTFARELIFERRSDIDLALDRQKRAISKGARQCTGGRRMGPHACSAALAVEAVRQGRTASATEKSAIKQILVKSGIVRDSLVRTARVMLATDPSKAVEEVAHELMHAAHNGMTWPDEGLIGLALQSEGRNPTEENVAWHRAKWVAVAASMIVGQETRPSDPQESWFVVPSDSGSDGEIDYRQQRHIPPSERCVACFANIRMQGQLRTSKKSLHMKTLCAKPSGRCGLSACKSASVKDSRRKAVLPHYETAEEECRVLPTPATNPEAEKFPFFHDAAREPKELDSDHSRRLAARIATIKNTSTRLAMEDKAMAEARMPRAAPASDSQASRATQPSPPQRPPAPRQERRELHPPRAEPEPAGFSPEGQRLGEERRNNEEQKLAEERRVAREERKRRRAETRKERAIEAETFQRQRLHHITTHLQQVLDLTDDEDDEHRKESEKTAADPSPSNGGGSSSSSSGKKKKKPQRKNGSKGGAKSGAKGNAVSQAISEEDEGDDDDQALCIVCMTEQRNACLVHGKTSHQIVCVPCGDRLKAANMGCPMCKRPIDAVIENFTS